MTIVPASKPRLVIVDDERHICEIIVESLAGEDYDVESFADAEKAIAYLKDQPVDLVLTDLVMGDISGVEVLEAAHATQADTVVILMTAYPTVQTAVSVLKKGAYDLLVKPFKLEVVRAAVKRGLAHQKLSRDNVNLRGQVEFLKAANGVNVGVDHERYLATVLSSCRTELRAVAAGLIEIDPKTRRVIRRLEDPEQHECRDILLDERTITEFIGKKVLEPRISSCQGRQGDNMVEQTLVSSPIYIRNRLHGLINLLLPTRFARLYPGQMDVLAILTNAAGSAIVNQKLYQNVRSAFIQAIKALANAVEARDKYTAGHTDRVIKLAEQVAMHLRWSKRQMETMTVGCMLHDIGKIGVPDSILNKPEQLDEREREIMRNHPLVGVRIVREIELFKPAIPYIISHHERYDGTGYPKGLKGTEIPIEGRLLSVVDTFDAIMSDRPYRKGAQLATAVSELVDNRGKQFDPEMVDAFLEVLRRGAVSFVDLYGRDVDTTCLFPSPATEAVSV
ncbi:hypothetical protein C3F09_10650 [candidate division GN15 bacterium]|uniref:Response regulator n=1 Tax=candidate division GN15 bacterium TaxID=2072418 RepID=A0A855X3B8_9BACT|nr:MAG: hypothetical protein C3F09_10650 [candidate division GN15 bacterium]